MDINTSSADVCTTSRSPGHRKPNSHRHTPPKPRAVAMLFPAIPGRSATDADFFRALFLRDLAAMEAGKKMLAKAPPFDQAAQWFLFEGMFHQRAAVRESFANWMKACGGLAGNAEGGAA